ncbi:hypothetical protein Agub_g6459, partial [Astrephomene gubernaculifera]
MDKLVGAISGVLKTPAAPHVQPQTPQGDRQYLRLPLESARRLRWFEKGDVQALTKAHFREKRDLLDAIAALKKVLLRHGLSETKLDEEVSAHVRSAAELAEAHEGVASVLLAALEAHLEEMRSENARLQSSLRMGQHATPNGSSADHAGPPDSSRGANGLPNPHPDALNASTSSTPPRSLAPHLGLPPHHLEHLDLAQLASSSAGTALTRIGPQHATKQHLAALEAQCAQYDKQVSELKTALTQAQQQLMQATTTAAPSSSSISSSRRREGSHSEGAQPSSSAAPSASSSSSQLAQLQDLVLELQEAARDEARRSSRAEARAGRLEGELKTLQAQHRTLLRDHSAAQQRVTELQQRAEAAAATSAARVAEAAAAEGGLRAAAEAREEVAALRQVQSELQASLAAAQGSVSRLEAELQSERHLRSCSQSEAAALSGRCEELAAAHRELSERLAGSRGELERAAYHKKLCCELTAATSRLQEQLVELAGQQAAAGAREQALADRLAAAEDQLAAAEARARSAEASVAAEVERRCAASWSSRALWPQPLREEVAALEGRLAAAEAAVAEAGSRAEAAEAEAVEAREQLRVKSEELAACRLEATRLASSSAQQLQQLRQELAEAQARAAGLRHDLAAERAAAAQVAAAAAREEEVRRCTAAGEASRCGGAGGDGRNGNGHASCTMTAVMTPKWQVQNRVGGGGLYNLDA